MTLNISSLCIRSMYLHNAIQTDTVSLNINIYKMDLLIQFIRTIYLHLPTCIQT